MQMIICEKCNETIEICEYKKIVRLYGVCQKCSSKKPK